MIRYANDLRLTDLARSLTNYMADLNVLLRDGHLESAKLVSETMRLRLERLEDRIKELCESR